MIQNLHTKANLKIKNFSELFEEVRNQRLTCNRCGFEGDRTFFINKKKKIALCEYCYHYYYNLYQSLLEKRKNEELGGINASAIIAKTNLAPEIKTIQINGVDVGCVKEDVYLTTRRAEHFMRKYQGFGISQDILKELESMGVKYVLIRYKGKREDVYFLSLLSQYLKSDKSFLYGSDFQKFVSIRDMIKVEVK